MGEVYKARDTRLDRTVAIKILPSTDDERRQRFAREAKAIAALSHPTHLHASRRRPSGRHHVDFMVMEYLEGETLAERLKAGPLSCRTSCSTWPCQIADALEAAHAARHLSPRSQAAQHHRHPARPGQGPRFRPREGPERQPATDASGRRDAAGDRGLTSPGTTLGTIAYMAPEQARGDDTDAPGGPLLVWRRSLRDGDRPAGVLQATRRPSSSTRSSTGRRSRRGR